MGWRSTVERARWRTWQLVTLGAVAATLVWARGRWSLLAPRSGGRTCRVLGGPDSLLPADCWLVRGVVGVPEGPPRWSSTAWVAVGAAAVLAVIGAAVAGSSPRRQRTVVLVALAWSVGLWVSAFAADVNARSVARVGWPSRAVLVAPAVLATVLAVAAWTQSPWTTLTAPGLRARRRASGRAPRPGVAGSRVLVGVAPAARPGAPRPALARSSGRPATPAAPPASAGAGERRRATDLAVVPCPVRLRWPVPAEAGIVSPMPRVARRIVELGPVRAGQ